MQPCSVPADPSPFPRLAVRRDRVLAVDIFDSSPALIASNIQSRRVNICVAERSRFLGGDSSNFPNQLSIPRMSLTQLGRKTRGDRKSDTTETLIAEIHRNSKSRFLDKEALHFIHGPHMLLYVSGINAARALSPTIEVFVDIGDAIFPNSTFPFRRGQLVFQDSSVAV